MAEIVGAEGLQDADRLLMRTAERIRTEFLQQNAYSEDAFSPPEKTLAIMKRHHRFPRPGRGKTEAGDGA